MLLISLFVSGRLLTVFLSPVALLGFSHPLCPAFAVFFEFNHIPVYFDDIYSMYRLVIPDDGAIDDKDRVIFGIDDTGDYSAGGFRFCSELIFF